MHKKIKRNSRLINFAFFRYNFKENIWIMVVFLALFILTTCVAMTFASGGFYIKDTGGEQYAQQGLWDAIQYFNVFGWLGEILIAFFAVILSLKFINIEISKGYMASWLTLPMSRTTILLTRFLNFFVYSLMIVVVDFIVQLTFSGIGYWDFNGNNVISLFELNLGLLLMFVFIFSIVMFVAILVHNPYIMMTILFVILTIFITFAAFPDFISSTKWMRYCTPFSLYDLFYSYDDPKFGLSSGVNNHDSNTIWKYILIILFSLGISTGIWWIFKHKDLQLG